MGIYSSCEFQHAGETMANQPTETVQRRRKTELLRQILSSKDAHERKSLADKSGVSENAISGILNGSLPQQETYRKLVDSIIALNWAHQDDFKDGNGGVATTAPSEYEKTIIKTFHGGKQAPGNSDAMSWPEVETRTQPVPSKNPIPPATVGRWRYKHEKIAVTARANSSGETTTAPLTFLEAGPRQEIYFSAAETLKVGVLVSGGIAPGINSIIDGIVERHGLYFRHGGDRGSELIIKGYKNGLDGCLQPHSSIELREDLVRENADSAGSLIGTSRLKDLEQDQPVERREEVLIKILERFQRDRLDIVYILGGDGTMKAAHALHTTGQKLYRMGKMSRVPSIVGVPKTMDNDVLWLWQSLGFQTAVARATEFVRQLHTEVLSNPRLCIVQLYGSDSGFMVSHAALASGVCDAALIPEIKFSMKNLSSFIAKRLQEQLKTGKTPHGIILIAETSMPEDVEDFFEDPDIGLTKDEKMEIRSFRNNGGRVYGQTKDELRNGGLRVISKGLLKTIQSIPDDDGYWKQFRVFVSEPRHLIRAVAPTAMEIIFGHRLGTLAVDTAMAGYTDCMISQWLTEYVIVPLSLVVQGKKRVPPDGIFWRSVVSSTNQPDTLVDTTDA